MQNEIKNEKTLKAAIYIRVSTVDQTDKYGPDLQLSKIKNYLEVRSTNLEFVGKEISFDDEFVFYDGAVSGADKIELREEMSRLFDVLDYSGKNNRPFDVIIIYKIDRFARDLRVLLDISDKLKEFGVGFISTQESIDTSNPFGNAMLGILGVFAELEREMIKERTMLGMEESFKNGIAKKVPYGYRKDADTGRTIVYEEEAKIVREIFEDIEMGVVVSQICKDLKERKVLIPTASGSDKSHLSRITDIYKWEDSTIRKILVNDFYIGKLYYKKTRSEKLKNGRKKTIHLPKSQWMLSPIFHTPIIGEDTFKKVNEIIVVKKGNFHRSNNNYLLSGLIRCGYCEENRPLGIMDWSGTGGNKGMYYHCSGKKTKNTNKIDGYICPCMQLGKEELEELVLYEIKGIFNNVDILEKYINDKKNLPNFLKKKEKELSNLNAKIIKTRNAIDNLHFIASEGGISPIDFPLKLKKKKEELGVLQKELKVLKYSFKRLFNKESYTKGFNIIKVIVEKDIDNLFKSDDKTKKILHFIIEDIYLYSRDKLDTDIIRGKSKPGQKIPYKMKIRFKLPQEFLKEYIKFSTKGE